MQSKEELLESLLEINPNYNPDLIEKAYDVGVRMHDGQLRKSGEPYFVHPLAVAKILAELGMDERTIVAGLLHDVVEDTEYTRERLKTEFGEEIMLLVDGVTKLGSLKVDSKEERQAENLRKMFLAMSKDIRVLIIKLADRLHNLRTINYMTEPKILEKCQETLDIYAPLASRLGIYALKFELEDIALKYLDPDAYYALVEGVQLKKEQREATINKVMDEISEKLEEMKIQFDIMGRSKHFYSIYKKMRYQNKQLDEIFDLTAVRILVDSIRDCYGVLGIVHTMWKPIPGKFKDYIAMPKPNMYQSLHTTVIGDNGDPFEIQIRTYEMHKIAEYGIAAHWKYKEGVQVDVEEGKIAWLRQMLELQKDMNDPMEFMESLRVDLFASQVFVFTPQSEVIELPAGSTPLDFAFKIHSAIGYKCIGAKINGKMVPIDHVLENGDIVEIVTSSNSSGPSVDWLKIAKSSNARSKIRSWLRKENRSDSVDKGKELLDSYVKRRGLNSQLLLKHSNILKIAKEMNLNNEDELYNQLSQGGSIVSKVVHMLQSYVEEEDAKRKKTDSVADIAVDAKKKSGSNKSSAGVKVAGVDNLLIRIAGCCNPVPGDEIVGFITKGRGISVHRKDCINMNNLPVEEHSRFIDVEWEKDLTSQSYNTTLLIIAEDRKGLFSDISKKCEDMNVDITGVNAKSGKAQLVSILLTISISSRNEMEKVLMNFKSLPSVVDVRRSK